MPHVSVKQDFLRCPPPKAKGHGVDRSTFPQSMNKDIVALPDFKAYMEKDLNKKGKRLKQHYIGATRALGALKLRKCQLMHAWLRIKKKNHHDHHYWLQ